MKVQSIYVVGGQQKKGAHFRNEWHHYQKATILEVNPETGYSRQCMEYVSPSEVCPDKDPCIVFKAGTLKDNKLYVPTQTEVLVYQIPEFKQIGYISLPCFNDLHHVQPTSEGNMLVVCTGLDMVVEVSPLGEILREWDVLGEKPWKKFSKEVDYRKVVSTKPHKSHPNYVFTVGENIWVTRFEQKDALCLTNLNQYIQIEKERCHDGIVYKNLVYFTTVNGYIVVADLKNHNVKQVFDLNQISNQDPKQSLGWCRGLNMLDENLILVGFSRLRPTKFVENLQWVRYQLGKKDVIGHMPTRIALYDLKLQKLCWEKNLEDEGLNVIFSIHTYPTYI